MTTPERIAEIINADERLYPGCKTALIELVTVAYDNLTRGDGGSIDLRRTPDSVTMSIDRKPDPFSI